MTQICLCLTGPTIARNLEVLERYRSKVDCVELRVDKLNSEEQFHIRKFPECAKIPCILSVRRSIDGGNFIDGEGQRLVLLAKGLSFASQDSRQNFAYIDLESDVKVAALEEAARTFGTKIIRSKHYFKSVPDGIEDILRTLPHHPDEIPKLAVNPQNMEDTLKIFKSAQFIKNDRFILLGMGEFGTVTRILAPKIGSSITYTTPHEIDFPVAGPGQIAPDALIDLYKLRQITENTQLYGIVGLPLEGSKSPRIHNPAFSRANINAVYIPYPSDSIESFFDFADFMNIKGFSVTVPYKERVLPYLKELSPAGKIIGAVNTVIRTKNGWRGSNTDADGFIVAALTFLNKNSLRGVKTTLIGAGGAAKAIAYALSKQRAKVVILNRTPFKAMKLAKQYHFQWGGTDSHGLKLLAQNSELIIQATRAGMYPEEDIDPIEFYDFDGHESVMDIVYKPAETKLLLRARMSGARTMNGLAMLKHQAEYQFTEFTGLAFPKE